MFDFCSLSVTYFDVASQNGHRDGSLFTCLFNSFRLNSVITDPFSALSSVIIPFINAVRLQCERGSVYFTHFDDTAKLELTLMQMLNLF